MKNLAVNGATLEHDTGSLISSGVFVIISVPSTQTKENGNGIYITPLQYTFSGGNASGFVPGSVATVVTQSINATAVNTKDFDKAVMREDDSGIMNCVGSLTGGGTGPVAGSVVIGNAGQTKVIGE